jgi:hypothetical protein
MGSRLNSESFALSFSCRKFLVADQENNQLVLIFLIDKLAAASPSRGGRGCELQSHPVDFSVAFSRESSRSGLIGFRIRINRIGTAGCRYCPSRGEGCQRW